MAKNNFSILDISNLTVSYGKNVAIREVNIKIEKGEVVFLIGANGAGKSTLMKGILGLQRANHGAVVLRGVDITRASVDKIVSSGIVLVPEGRGIIREMSVMENLELGAYHCQKNLNNNLEQVFQQFPILKERKGQEAGLMSGGEQQMLAIGRAMMGDPILIMMDEPSLGLAPIVVSNLFKTITRMKEGGYTILLAEQNALKALQISDRGYVFEKGCIVFDGLSKDMSKNEKIQHAYLGR